MIHRDRQRLTGPFKGLIIMSAIVSKVCGNCAGYCSNGDDPTCRETGQPVGYLWVRECWKEKAASELGKAVADEIQE